MKNQILTTLSLTLTTALFLMATPSRAEDWNTRFNNLNKTLEEAQRLNGMTQNGTRYPQLRTQVAQFTTALNQLVQCERPYAGQPIPLPPAGSDRYTNRFCDTQLRDTLGAFGMVNYYLFDTDRDASRVYDQFRRVYNSLHAYLYHGEVVGAGTGGGACNPGGENRFASGQMDAYTFTFSAADLVALRTQCVNFATQNSLRLIACLDVNGSRFGRCVDNFSNPLSVDEACDQVVKNAR